MRPFGCQQHQVNSVPSAKDVRVAQVEFKGMANDPVSDPKVISLWLDWHCSCNQYTQEWGQGVSMALELLEGRNPFKRKASVMITQ